MSSLLTPAYAPRPTRFSLDDKPQTPHAYDDEFEGSSLDPKWTRLSSGTFADATPIDPYTTFTTGHRSSLNSYRKSWYMWQPSSTGGTVRLYQAITVPTDCFVWARLSFNFRYNAVANNDSTIGIALHASAAGVPDDSNRAYVYLSEADVNVVQAQGGRTSAGADASTTMQNIGPQTGGVDCFSQPFCYVGIQKLGTTYRFGVASPNGNWVLLASQTLASTIAFAVLDFTNTSATSPGNMLMGADFFRFVSGRHLP